MNWSTTCYKWGLSAPPRRVDCLLKALVPCRNNPLKLSVGYLTKGLSFSTISMVVAWLDEGGSSLSSLDVSNETEPSVLISYEDEFMLEVSSSMTPMIWGFIYTLDVVMLSAFLIKLISSCWEAKAARILSSFWLTECISALSSFFPSIARCRISSKWRRLFPEYFAFTDSRPWKELWSVLDDFFPPKGPRVPGSKFELEAFIVGCDYPSIILATAI